MAQDSNRPPRKRRTRRDWDDLAGYRLMRVLAKQQVCSMRTLENKISDGGPSDMRVDPHVLTRVRKDLLQDGTLKEIQRGRTPWYHHREADAATVDLRLSELVPLHTAFNKISPRIGQALEIAVWRALREQNRMTFFGHFADIDDHDDSKPYSKEEPPRTISGLSVPGKKSLDFLTQMPGAGFCGIEVKNIREWLYPDRQEITDLLLKCTAINAVPVLIARRIHFATFAVLSRCGVIMHEVYNQRVPHADLALVERVKHKTMLGYHDIRTGNLPDERLRRFITTNLPEVAPAARIKYDRNRELLEAYGTGEMEYKEFAARVRRRWEGTEEDSDEIPWEDIGDYGPAPEEDEG